jgi:hypothetical protein
MSVRVLAVTKKGIGNRSIGVLLPNEDPLIKEGEW